MRRRTLIWAIIIALISLAVFALIYDGRPLKKPVYHVGQVVEMVMGKDQGIVMKVRRGTDTCTYWVKFYYKSRIFPDEVKKFKEYELRKK